MTGDHIGLLCPISFQPLTLRETIDCPFTPANQAAMAIELIEISDQHQRLLQRLSELIPDLDPDTPESMQRIFGLGLIALTMQIASRARQQDQAELVEELSLLAREMVEAEDRK